MEPKTLNTFHSVNEIRPYPGNHSRVKLTVTEESLVTLVNWLDQVYLLLVCDISLKLVCNQCLYGDEVLEEKQG